MLSVCSQLHRVHLKQTTSKRPRRGPYALKIQCRVANGSQHRLYRVRVRRAPHARCTIGGATARIATSWRRSFTWYEFDAAPRCDIDTRVRSGQRGMTLNTEHRGLRSQAGHRGCGRLPKLTRPESHFFWIRDGGVGSRDRVRLPAAGGRRGRGQPGSFPQAALCRMAAVTQEACAHPCFHPSLPCKSGDQGGPDGFLEDFRRECEADLHPDRNARGIPTSLLFPMVQPCDACPVF
jgi:hypothetical protein